MAAQIPTPLATLPENTAPTHLWLSPKSLIPLEPTQTHIWRIDLAPEQPLATTLLSPEELARVERFRHAESQAHFIAGRSALRLLLAHHLGVAPNALTFNTTPHGKPTLAQPTSLSFNMSHSGGSILIALAHHAHLGVDLERITPSPNPLEIAARMFSPAEQSYLASLPSAAQRLAFFRLWSRKEAIMKADGRGLSLPTTSFNALNSAVVIDTTTFYLHDLPFDPTHAAAICTTSPQTTLHLLRFPSMFLPA